jgi:hypothetical protein
LEGSLKRLIPLFGCQNRGAGANHGLPIRGIERIELLKSTSQLEALSCHLALTGEIPTEGAPQTLEPRGVCSESLKAIRQRHETRSSQAHVGAPTRYGQSLPLRRLPLEGVELIFQSLGFFCQVFRDVDVRAPARGSS